MAFHSFAMNPCWVVYLPNDKIVSGSKSPLFRVLNLISFKIHFLNFHKSIKEKVNTLKLSPFVPEQFCEREHHSVSRSASTQSEDSHLNQSTCQCAWERWLSTSCFFWVTVSWMDYILHWCMNVCMNGSMWIAMSFRTADTDKKQCKWSPFTV